MIARMWHGMVPEALADEYQNYINEDCTPGLS